MSTPTPCDYQAETDRLAGLLTEIDAADERLKSLLMDLDGSPGQAEAYLDAANAATWVEIKASDLRQHLMTQSHRLLLASRAQRKEPATV